MREGYKLGENVLRHALVGVVDTVAGNGAEAVTTVDAESAPETEPGDTDDNADTSGR